MFSKSISSIEILYLSRLIRNDHLVRWPGQSHGGQPLVAGLPTYNKYWFLWVCGMLFWLTSSYSPIFGRGCKKSREVCLKFSLWKFYFNMETQCSDKKSRVWLHCTFVKIWITKTSTSTRRAQIQPNQKQWCCFYHGWEQGKKSNWQYELVSQKGAQLNELWKRDELNGLKKKLTQATEQVCPGQHPADNWRRRRAPWGATCQRRCSPHANIVVVMRRKNHRKPKYEIWKRDQLNGFKKSWTRQQSSCSSAAMI